MSVLLYWLGVKGYELAIRIASLWNEKAAEAVRGRRGLLDRIETAMQAEKRPRIWMHCASLGEFEQGRPVLEALRRAHPGHACVLTFFSPSGYRVRKDWDGADHVFYLPFDGAARARRLVCALQPALAVWVKYEFWYFTLRALKRAKVPTVLIAAVFSRKAPAVRWWGGLHRRMARMFDWVFTQDDSSRERLQAIGITYASAAGDPRYDRVLAASEAAEELDKAALFAATGFTIVAGSTWPADEAALVSAMQMLPSTVRLLLVPHEVDEMHLRSIEARFGIRCVRWSNWDADTAPRVLLVDRVGLLMSLYRYADVAYVGGGFGRAGVHNVLEPAAHGVPVIIGPEYGAYHEAVELVERGAASVVRNGKELAAEAVQGFLDGDALRKRVGGIARQVVVDGAGATERIVAHVQQFLGKAEL